MNIGAIVLIASPAVLLAVVAFRWWMYGEDAATANMGELNAEKNVQITRLDLTPPATSSDE